MPGKPCSRPHSTLPTGAVSEGVVGPRTLAALTLVNLTAYLSEQTLVQIVPLSGAGSLVHLQGLSAGRTLLTPQALHAQDAAPSLLPATPFAGRLMVPAGWRASSRVRASLAAPLPGELQTDLGQAWDCSAARRLRRAQRRRRGARRLGLSGLSPAVLRGSGKALCTDVPTPAGVSAHGRQ